MDGDRRADEIGQALKAAVLLCPLTVPRAEHRGDGAEELLHGVLRKRSAGQGAIDVLLLSHHGLHRRDLQLGRHGDPVRIHGSAQNRVERVCRASVNHLGICLYEPTVGIPHEHRVAGGTEQARQRGVAQPHVEDGLEHPRHRDGSPRADREQQRAAPRTEVETGRSLNLADSALHVRDHVGVKVTAGLMEVPADGRTEHEGPRHRQPSLAHQHEVECLAAHHLGAGFPRAGCSDDVERPRSTSRSSQAHRKFMRPRT